MKLDVNLVPDGNPFDQTIKPKPEDPENDSWEFGDTRAVRSAIYDRVFQSLQNLEPVSNKQHTLQLRDISWADPENYSKRDQKQAIVTGQTRGRRIRGTWELLDDQGKLLDRRKQVVASVPYMTERGTFVHQGSEYMLRNQQRLRSGVYTRQRENGEVEAHVNVLPGKGSSHRYFLEPESGVFYTRIGQAKIPLMPLLSAMGASGEELREAWGPELYANNYAKKDGAAIGKYAQKVLRDWERDEEQPVADQVAAKWASQELDPEVTKRTLGQPYDRTDKQTILATTRKLLAIQRGEADTDDRDSLAYQQFMGPEDLFAERIQKDYGRMRRQLLYKLGRKGDLSSMPSSALKKQLESAILGSGLGVALEEVNAAEILDKLYAISRLGEGGIPSIDSIPEEARSVQPSHAMFMDPIRTPESARAGVDVFLARNTRKGRDGKIYTQLKDPKTEKLKWMTPQEVADQVVAFPGSLERPGKHVVVMKDGQMTRARKQDVTAVMPEFESAFSPVGNLVPLKSTVKGQRMSMASRMLTQALPLREPQAPLVQSAVPGTNGQRSYEEEYAKYMGALHADQDGQVLGVTDDGIRVRYADGQEDEIELYHNFPFNRKTFYHQTPLVRPGDQFKSGQLLVRSNYTDEQGATALGRNARTAYLSWQGMNHEDATVISQSFADALSSEQMYQENLELDDRTNMDKRRYIGLFPGRYDKQTLETIDDRGLVKTGTVVQEGQPLILAVREREMAENKVHKKGKPAYGSAAVTWDHSDPGLVTDVIESKNGPVVLVKATMPMQVGDKLSGRFGDKGIVSQIVPDDQMPVGADGRPYEVLLNPLGIVSRTNPGQVIETLLGKLAEKQGRPIKVEDWQDKDYTRWALEQLQQAGISDTEALMDPSTDRKIRDILTGNRFFMKLHHQAESKGQARASGQYTAEGAPAKGGKHGSKRIAMLNTNALLAHGAVETLRDVTAVRGQQHDDYWLQFMQGYSPNVTKIPKVYEKFVDHLRGSGINVVRKGTQTNIMALTDKDVNALAEDRELQNAEGVDWKEGLKPISGGLFDKKLTGGHDGNRWSSIRLSEPMPSPVMEEPIRKILGLTQKQFEGVLSGEHKLPKCGTGPSAIVQALDKLDLDREIQTARTQIQHGSKTEMDQAVRKLGYLKSAKQLDIHPRDWILSRMPVLPPIFRPVSTMGNKMPLVSDANYLYKELWEANQNLEEMHKAVGDETGTERLAVYQAMKAVTGLGDPLSQKSKEKGVRGLLKSVFGSSPKFGMLQRKLISTTVDNVGRAVISPNPDLDMDHVGLPEDMAFDVYSKFIARRLRRRGMPISQALEQIRDRTDVARKALVAEMDQRPVYIDRAPVLHKFGIMAFRPQLTKGNVMQISPMILNGFNADFDGDMMNFHVPTSDEAVEEAYERMLPSKNLISPRDYRSPMHMPGREFVGGLYYATSPKSRSKRPARIFRTVADARAAWEDGKLNLNDPVRILESP